MNKKPKEAHVLALLEKGKTYRDCKGGRSEPKHNQASNIFTSLTYSNFIFNIGVEIDLSALVSALRMNLKCNGRKQYLPSNV